jgi:hypothetical protein
LFYFFLLQKILYYNKLEFIIGSFKQYFLNGNYSAVFQVEDNETKRRYNADLKIFKIKKKVNIGFVLEPLQKLSAVLESSYIIFNLEN